MGVRLYPPNIEGTIPAFYGTELTVPFSMNKSVSQDSVYGMQIKIKSVQSGAYLLTSDTTNITYGPYYKATFNLSEENSKLRVGQHYKIQIAYIGQDGEVGYFSTVAVVKYTEKPQIEIKDLDYSIINNHIYEYIGLYSNADLSEKVYSYQFDLYDMENNLIQTSGEKLHNADNDDYNTYRISNDLKENEIYILEYSVITSNELQASKRYRIRQTPSVKPEIDVNVIATMNFENGYMDITMKGKKDADGIEPAISGKFRILRSGNDGLWYEIHRFALPGLQPSKWSWRDYLIEQGKEYTYAIQQYNDNDVFSNRIESNTIIADFEHIFLYDGKCQLKVKYNPKVSNFKNNILESKLNTIGGQYPFIFRNGNVKYKEFAISGLISCQSDNEFLFMNEDDFGNFDFSTNLISENIKTERDFKLRVLEWLNNGEPKVFRSATEGNYIVRLMNVSLQPVDSLGRMLHTFNATAYEIMEYNYENLNTLNIISIGEPAVRQLQWETLVLNGYQTDISLNGPAVSLSLEFMPENETITIDGVETLLINGSYNIPLDLDMIINNIKFSGKVQHNNSRLTYAYYTDIIDSFQVRSISVDDVISEQYYGECDVVAEIEADENISMGNVYQIKCYLKNRETIYNNGEKYYTDKDCLNEINEFSSFVLYDVKDYLIDEVSFLLDGKDQRQYDSYSSIFILNNIKIDLAEILEYTIDTPNVENFSLGNGVIAEISYQRIIKEI